MTTGIELIKQKIREEAEAEAASIKVKAEAEAAAVREAAEAHGKTLLAEAAAQSEKESALVRERTEASAQNLKRDLLLKEKGALLENAFDKAKEAILAMPAGDYTKLLTGLMTKALDDHIASEAAFAAYEEEEFQPVSAYVLKMSARDEALGSALVKSAAPHLAPLHKTLSLGASRTDLDAGFVLVAGDVTIDCSLSALMAELKQTLSGEVAACLFG